MEIGHNVMHGQYDWMGDPKLNSRIYDWDNVCPGEQWKYSHNYIHHTFTNVLGKDRDIGYGILRMDEDQPWHPYYLGNPVYALPLMLFFEWGVAMHDLEVENLVKGTRDWEENKSLHAGIMRKVKRQALKDYVLFPALTGPLFPLTFAGNATANLIRNVWAFNIIFCGHFPAGVATFTEEECLDIDGPNGREESRGHWYYRQLLGSANIDRQQALPPDERQPQPPDRAPPLPRHPGAPLPRARRSRCRRSASATACRTTPDRWASSSSASPARSAGWRCRPASRLRSRRRLPSPPSPRDTGPMTRLSKNEIRKDAVQDTVAAAATAVGQVTTIITGAVKDVAGSIGGFATEVFEIRESAKKAQDDEA